MPEVTDGGRTYTLRLKKGIYFADDPAFKGRKRELVARDYEFAIKRLIDPTVRSPNLWLVEGRIAGMDARRAKAQEGRQARLRRADCRASRCSTATRCASASPSPTTTSSTSSRMRHLGAQAREVVEHYGADIGAHPVGTGPFLLEGVEALLEDRARDESQLPRGVLRGASPPPTTRCSQQLYARDEGQAPAAASTAWRSTIIEESQPRWLAFLNNELDWINLPYEFKSMALPDGKPAPWAGEARRALHRRASTRTSPTCTST